MTGNVAVLTPSEGWRPLRIGDRPSLYTASLSFKVKGFDSVKSMPTATYGE